MPSFLPIYKLLPDVKRALRENNQLILQAAPGAGKTTLVPISLLNEPWLEGKKIIMLEPRRLAARAAATRMASLLNEKVGERIGYIVHAEKVVSKDTKILVVTEAILTKMLLDDAELSDVALVIFDEFHERNLDADLSLALSLESQMLLREDLKLLVMSATLNAEKIKTLLSSAEVLISEGKQFPLKIKYSSSDVQNIPLEILKIVKNVKAESFGILVFLAGEKEIKQTHQYLQEYATNNNISILELFGSMSKEQQTQTLNSQASKKIILSTNIAESSLTLNGINIVIDSGLQKSAIFNYNSGMNSLKTHFISAESATQRSGRAARECEGTCYRLWSKNRSLMQEQTPEILQSDLTQFVLSCALWGISSYGELLELSLLDYPSQKSFEHLQTLLQELNALNENCKITPHGKKMAQLSAHPRLAHMMLASQELHLTHEASIVAALLSETGLSHCGSDLLEQYERFQANPHNYFFIKRTADIFYKKIRTSQKANIDESIAILVALAYPERIAKIREKNSTNYLLASSKGAKLRENDTLFNSEYLVIAHLQDAKVNAQIFTALAISKESIEKYFIHLIQKRVKVTFNKESGKVEAREYRYLGAIRLSQKALEKVPSDAVRKALLHYIKTSGLKVLKLSKESQKFLERVNFYNYHSQEKLENFSEDVLLENLELWLEDYLEGIKSLKDLQALNFKMILQARLSYEQMQDLNTALPQKLQVPSGSKIAIDYSDFKAPKISVRLQEIFTLYETPKVLHNTIPLTIELLSPAHRPMQITKDLHSFWQNTYADVRKDLRGKYKKHYWPEDPFKAVATNKTKKIRACKISTHL